MEKLYIEIKGRTPLLMNNPAKTMAVEEEGATKGRVKQPQPDEQAELRRYLLPDGTLYMPAPAVRKALLTASRGYTGKGTTGRRIAVSRVLPGALILEEPAFPLVDDEGNQIDGENYEVRKDRVVIAATRAAIWRGRPQIWPWNLTASFLFESKLVAIELVEAIARDAGRYPGLLDFRPEKGGWFGTFEVVKVWSEEI